MRRSNYPSKTIQAFGKHDINPLSKGKTRSPPDHGETALETFFFLPLSLHLSFYVVPFLRARSRKLWLLATGVQQREAV